MHRTAPGTNWRQVEYQTRMQRHRRRVQAGDGRSDCQLPSAFAGGRLTGRWAERGSNNQTGSIIEIAYDRRQDEIWLISAGGSIWSGSRKNPDWAIRNQDLQFDQGFLQILPINKEQNRLLAFSGGLPHYSDDEGKRWQIADGIKSSGLNPDFHSPVLLEDLSYFFLSKGDYYHNFEIYRSGDMGRSFQKIMMLDSYEKNYFSLCRPHHTNSLFLARKTPEKKLRLQRWHAGQQVFVEIPIQPALHLGNAPANLIGGTDSLGQLQLYTYTEKAGKYLLHKSKDEGKSWKELGPLPAAPWEVGLYLSPNRQNTLFLGEVEAFRTYDDGLHWEKINDWWEYYDQVDSALHADIMTFGEFETSQGERFTLIGHHGGLSISYDYFESQRNIGMTDLNTSQYYSVRTDPNDPGFVYAGSQDQGLQRAVAFTEDPGRTEAFEQLISGDYGPIVFTRSGTALWTVYPGGWVNYYDNPQSGNLQASYELISEDEPVWLPPLMPDPLPGANAVYMAGGNHQGGSGSFLIRLEYKNKKLEAGQIPYDFKLESGGGALSALGTAPSEPDYWYTATTNGRFFYSRDQGKNWEQSLNFIPQGHYLYGQAIHVSKQDPKQVILAGSGYDNPPVYRSTDGGQSFQSMDEGLPPTLVFSLASNADESLLFAATEAGPFVYVARDERWYDLSTACTPVQTYWSVEYVAAIRTARFATYGRGIWDLTLDIDTPAPEPPSPVAEVRIFPNPTTGPLHVSLGPAEAEISWMIRNGSGRIVRRGSLPAGQDRLQLDLVDLASGVYFLILQSEGRVLTKKIALLH